MAQFLGTKGSIVRYMSTKSIKVGNHAIERTAGTDGFLLSHFLIGNTVFTVQFSPSTLNDDVVKCCVYPTLVMLCKVIGSLHTKCFETCSITSPNAPNFINGI